MQTQDDDAPQHVFSHDAENVPEQRQDERTEDIHQPGSELEGPAGLDLGLLDGGLDAPPAVVAVLPAVLEHVGDVDEHLNEGDDHGDEEAEKHQIEDHHGVIADGEVLADERNVSHDVDARVAPIVEPVGPGDAVPPEVLGLRCISRETVSSAEGGRTVGQNAESSFVDVRVCFVEHLTPESVVGERLLEFPCNGRSASDCDDRRKPNVQSVRERRHVVADFPVAVVVEEGVPEVAGIPNVDGRTGVGRAAVVERDAT